MALNLGTCVGPIVGGWVAYKSGNYVWVFWFLVVVGAMLLLAVGGFLPETARNVVGNGTVVGRRWWEIPWGAAFWRWDKLARVESVENKSEKGSAERKHKIDGGGDATAGNVDGVARRGLRIPNPLSCLRILFWKDAAQILWMHGSFYMVDYCIQTSIPSSYKDIYHFNELEIGLSYLPRGAGIIFGGYANGKMMDRNYKVVAERIGHSIDRDQGDDINHFPIERARTRGSLYLPGTLTCVLIGYGWALDQQCHVSIPLILQFAQGFFGTSIYTISNTLLVDVFPERPSTAAAAASITRCALAALGVAIFEPLVTALGRGWYFTTLGLFTGAAGTLSVWTIRKWGMKWRSERVAKTNAAHLKDESREEGLRDQVGVPEEIEIMEK